MEVDNASLTPGGGTEENHLLDRLIKENAKLRRKLEKKEMEEWKRQKLESRLHPPFPHCRIPRQDDNSTGGGEEEGTVLEVYLKLKVKSLEATLKKKCAEIEQLRMLRNEARVKEEEEDNDEQQGNQREGEAEIAPQFANWRDPRRMEASVEDLREDEEEEDTDSSEDLDDLEYDYSDDDEVEEEEDNCSSTGSSTSSPQVRRTTPVFNSDSSSNSKRPRTPTASRTRAATQKDFTATTPVPSKSTLRSSTSTSRPTTSTSRPATSSSRTATFSSRPTTSTSRPSTPRASTSTSKPSTSTTKPSTSTLRPSRSTSKPSTSTSRPSTSTSRPSTPTSRPTTSTVSLRPSTSTSSPSTSTSRPSTSTSRPSTSTSNPSISTSRPSNSQPSTSNTTTPSPSTTIQVTPRRILRPSLRKRSYKSRTTANLSKHHDFDLSKRNACICGLVFVSRGSLQTHVRCFTEQGKFLCDKCPEPQRFFHLRSLRGHMLTSHDIEYPPGTIGCADCGAIFTNRKDHTEHRRTLHAKYNERYLRHGQDSTFSSPDGIKVKCVCGKEYANKVFLREHLRRFTNNFDFECKLCHRTYKTAANLQSHSKNVHKVAAHPRGTIGCGVCGKLFGVKKVYQQHMYQIHGIITWPVQQTPATPGPSDLRSRPGPHGRQPSTRKSSSPRHRYLQRCLCGSAYPTKALLNRHLAMMRPSVPFKCPYCSVEYLRHTKLAGHIRKTHNIHGYKGIGCNICGTTWSDKGALIKHRKMAHRDIFES